MLIDTHCHLDYPDFQADFDQVLDRAKQAGVTHMVSICVQLRLFPPILALAEKHENIYCSVGVHPHHAGHAQEDSEQPTVQELVALIKHPKVVGLGECGLDYFYQNSPKEEQQEGFRRHIRAALETGLPLIVHTRDAEEDTMRILKEECAGQPVRGLLHCFTSSAWLAEKAVEFGFYISLSGILTFKKSQALRDTAKNIPLERLLVETDAPYLAPEPHRGSRNEPAFVARTAAVLAEIKGVTLEELACVTTQNARRVFHKIAA